MENGAAGDRKLGLAATAFPMSLLITHLHDDLVDMLLDARPSLFPLLRAYVALGKAAVDRLSEEVPRTGLITYYWSDLPIAYGLLPPVPAIVTVFLRSGYEAPIPSVGRVPPLSFPVSETPCQGRQAGPIG